MSVTVATINVNGIRAAVRRARKPASRPPRQKQHIMMVKFSASPERDQLNAAANGALRIDHA